MNKKYSAEPYRIKMVEPIKETTREEREMLLKNAGYNPFSLKSEDVYIDLLTDSGTGAMSQEQWAAMMIGDEAYAGSKSFYKLESVVKNITGYQYFMPVHQGRGAEQVFLPQLVTKKGMYYISNIHFDTTRAHVELSGARAIDCVIEDCFIMDKYHPFKGNFDLKQLEKIILEKGPEQIAGIIMTITNNSAGGQPVSMENIREVKKIADRYHITAIIDGARYAENAFFIKEREKGYENKAKKEYFKLDKQSLLTDMNELIRLEIHIGAFESFNRKHKKANKTNRIRTIIFTTLVKETVNKKWDILNVANKIATNLAL